MKTDGAKPDPDQTGPNPPDGAEPEVPGGRAAGLQRVPGRASPGSRRLGDWLIDLVVLAKGMAPVTWGFLGVDFPFPFFSTMVLFKNWFLFLGVPSISILNPGICFFFFQETIKHPGETDPVSEKKDG